MRVLMTTDTVGGVWHYALELVRALGQVGVQVALATMGRPLTPAQHTQANALPNLRLFESAYRLEWMESPWRDVDRAGDWLLGLERSFRPDLIHLNNYAHGALPWRAPVLMVGHSCVCSWWEAVHRVPAPDHYDHYRQRVTAGLAAAHAVVAPSRFMLQQLERHYGPLPHRQVIPNGCDPARFRPAAKAPVMLTIGRLWDPAKHARLAAKVGESVPGWQFFLAGEARHPDNGEQHAGCGAQLGQLAPGELATWLGRTTVYISPARYEPFGLSVLEAALSGCALILSDIPTFRELWSDAAVFVPVDDENALRRAVHEITGNPGLQQRLMHAAFRRGRDFSLTATATRYHRLYRELSGMSNGAASGKLTHSAGHP